ncbi:MAG: glycoside hydrolase family 2 [Tannerella sp.]|jgi:hypothetical protein|nr:glycoside hydrolase family 2 [Tannerella sp.]
MMMKTYGRKCWICGVFFLFAANSMMVNAQTEWGKTGLNVLWQGLRDRQPEEQMPVSKAPFQKPLRVAKKNIPTRLIPVQTNEWLISDGWELGTATQVIESAESIFSLNFDTQNWYNATVPGTVLTTLVDQGVYPEPAFGLNNMAIPDTLCRMDWWYRTVFDYPSEAKGNRIKLLFNGINYRAEVFLNGKKLGNTDGAFIRGAYDITSTVKEKGNVLAVLIHPPYNPGIPHEQSMAAGQGLNGGQLSLDGPTFIASMGWDWIPGIRDRNTGIWQDVRLQVVGDVKIGDPHVISNLPLPDTASAALTISVPVKNLTGNAVNGSVEAAFNGSTISMPYTLDANEEKTLVFEPGKYKELNILNPELWWPNGYGAQYLYDLSLQANTGGAVSDIKKVRFGIRELSYELMIHTEAKGNHRILYTPVDADNGGKPVFNYEKVVVAGESGLRETIPSLQEGVNEANLFEFLADDDPVGQYLVFRVNGRRIFIKGATWGMDEMMKRLPREKMELFFQLEQSANFNMIRNWTGENTQDLFYELADEYGLLVWNDFWITTDDTVDPNDHQLFLRNATDVVRRFRTHPSIAVWCPRNEGYAPQGLERLLNEMIAREDPSRHYHGNSRHLNMINSGPYGYIKNESDYYTKYARGFNTELGAQSIPTATTIRKFIAPEDLWPINDVWAYHDLHHKSQFFGDFMEAVNSYGNAMDVDDFAKKGQMVCYNTWRSIIEAVNSKMWGNTTGLVLWMSHPSWPSMMWQTHTYDYETPGAYFGVKKAQESIHIQLNLPDNRVVVLNNTAVAQKGMTVLVKGYDTDGRQYYDKTVKIDALAGQKTDCFIADIEKQAPELALIRLELKNRKGETLSVNDYWKNWGNMKANQTLNRLEKVKLNATVRSSQKGQSVVEISNPNKAIAVAVKLNACNKQTGELILPAFFSEGYFNLLPGEKRKITLKLPPNSPTFDILVDGYNAL